MIKVKIILNKKIQLGLCQIANMYFCTTEKLSIRDLNTDKNVLVFTFKLKVLDTLRSTSEMATFWDAFKLI